MSIFFPVSEFFQSSGNAAAQFNEQLRDGIATFACGLWDAYPGWITQNKSPGASFARGYMNQMCSSIQPSPAPPDIPFTGGQCVGASYRVQGTLRNVVGTLRAWETNPQIVTGKIIGLSIFSGFWVLESDGGGFGTLPNGNAYSWVEIPVEVRRANPSDTDVTITSITRTDGQPDNCGNPPGGYPDVDPTINDLSTTIIINNLDGVDNTYNLTYNQIQSEVNFPMGFLLNGVNVTLDVGGITIYGDPGVTQPTSGNDRNNPGFNGGDNGIGGSNTTIFEEQDYPTLPELVTPVVVEKAIEYLVCNEGVIETVSETLKIVTSGNPLASIIIDILGQILTDICEGEEQAGVVGLPEYYPLTPGAKRPAIVFLYKEVIDGRLQRSTYSSTVQRPSQTAINNIQTLTVPDKTMGTYVTSLTLEDGSRIRASGDTEAVSLANFEFLFNQVDSAFVPIDYPASRVVSVYPKLQVKTIKCIQIEYYPTGAAANKSPALVRLIDVT